MYAIVNLMRFWAVARLGIVWRKTWGTAAEGPLGVSGRGVRPYLAGLERALARGVTGQAAGCCTGAQGCTNGRPAVGESGGNLSEL